ncbi:MULTISPECIES: ParA family protein [Bacillus]|uniref:ParA family protein n=1 Tax=Bacillus TaxID=1386 RepID=UPI000A050691|nr:MULTISPECIES: ParA family protein [Bacillus]HDR7243186.1 AAA family ATPase [Bacillus mobilis]
MKKVISFYSTKGGVCKTSSCTLLAHTLEEQGKKVLVVDMCQNGDVANNFGFNRHSFLGKTTYEWLTKEKTFEEVVVQVPGKNIFFIPSNNRIDELETWVNKNILRNKDEVLLKKLNEVKEDYDVVLIDCHPSQGSFSSICSLIPAELVYIPSLTDGNSLEGTYRAAQIVLKLNEEGMNLDYTIVPTRVYANSFGKVERIYTEKITEWVQDGVMKYCSVSIPDCRIVEDWTRKELNYEGLKKHKTGGKLVEEYNKIAKMIVEGEL